MRPVLDEVARNFDPKVRLAVIGHTDSTGTDAVNDPLSLQHARAVRDYLVARGVPAANVTIDGRGEHQPVASNDTPSGRAANRRVEMLLAERA
jgi:outer membrane protein OmpA-like peptidoglycan-associated protein